MTRVFFSVSVSLDGYLVPPGMDLEHAFDPGHQNWGSRWGELHGWLLATRFFQSRVFGKDGGDTGLDDQIAERTFARTGASVMGKRMFELGERMWPEEAPFHTDVFVLTSQPRPPWERPGGTTFHFVTEGLERAVSLARSAAGARDVRVAGGADMIQQALRAGLVEEFSLAISPVLFGGGRRLFENLGPDPGEALRVELVETAASPRTTHARYAVAAPARGGAS